MAPKPLTDTQLHWTVFFKHADNSVSVAADLSLVHVYMTVIASE